MSGAPAETDSAEWRRLVALVADVTRAKAERLSPRTRIAQDLRVAGDDAVDLFEAYAQEFGVALHGLDLGHHFGVEGIGCLGLVLLLRGDWPRLRAWWKRVGVRPVPITLGDLLHAARVGSWPAEVGREDALRIARDWLARRWDASGWRELRPVLDAPRGPLHPEELEPVVADALVREEWFGWVLPYQTRRALATGDARDGLVGNWPLVVDRRGNLYEASGHTGDERDWRDPLRPFKRGRFPAPLQRWPAVS